MIERETIYDGLCVVRIVLKYLMAKLKNVFRQILFTLDHREVVIENEHSRIDEMAKHCDINS